MKSRILAIVPARGGSKGIPNKNLKKLNGRPLITYILNTLSAIEYIDKIIVTSDSREILELAASFPRVDCLKRRKELSADKVTLDPVVFDAYSYARRNSDYDLIFTFQPTSPLLKKETIEKAIQEMIEKEYDTLVTVVDDRKLTWTIKNHKAIPLFKKRVNRQQLPPRFKETGGIVACSSKIISPKSRFGKNVGLLLVSEEEAIDIDTYKDWIFAEKILERSSFGFAMAGESRVNT